MTYEEALKILQLSPGATPDDIRRAYRTMAFKYHPDRNPNNKFAEEMFKTIVLANRILTEHKRVYNKHETPPQQPDTYTNTYTNTYTDTQNLQKVSFSDIENIINTFFASIESKNIDDATRAKLDTAKKLFYTIKNMNRFINFSFMSSMITLLSTIAYNLVFDHLPQNVALVVYPTVGVLVIAGLLTMEKTENKITEFLNIVDSLKQNVRC